MCMRRDVWAKLSCARQAGVLLLVQINGKTIQLHFFFLQGKRPSFHTLADHSALHLTPLTPSHTFSQPDSTTLQHLRSEQQHTHPLLTRTHNANAARGCSRSWRSVPGVQKGTDRVCVCAVRPQHAVQGVCHAPGHWGQVQSVPAAVWPAQAGSRAQQQRHAGRIAVAACLLSSCGLPQSCI